MCVVSSLHELIPKLLVLHSKLAHTQMDNTIIHTLVITAASFPGSCSLTLQPGAWE